MIARNDIGRLAVRAATAVNGTAARRTHADLIVGLVLFIGFLPLLTVLPYHVPAPRGVVSAAAAEGYSNQAAFLSAAVWLALGFIAAALVGWRNRDTLLLHQRAPSRALIGAGVEFEANADDRPTTSSQRIALLAGLVAAIVFVGYFPPFLAQRGPFIEDHIHLTALHRMLGGQRPYADFEFLYGPLMLYPAYGWVRVFGYSLASFYTYVALLEALVFAVAFVLVWRLVDSRRARVVAALVLGALLFNALIGPNWSASRRLLALLALLAVASGPTRPRCVALGGVLIGLQLAYSHDFGVAALAGAGFVYALLLLRAPRLPTVVAGGSVALGAVLVWLVTTRLLLGDDSGAYLAETSYLTRRFAAGEAGFRFYWTVNSLAAFGLLAFACVAIGRGLFRIREATPTRADLLLAAGFAFAILGLKSGLNRADLWHVTAPLLPLVFAILLPAGRRVFAVSGAGQTLGVSLTAVLAATYLFGLLPSASELARGWWQGLRDVAARDDGAPPQLVAAAAPLLGWDRRSLSPTIVNLARFVAEPGRAGRPAVFYSDTWTLGKHIGVYKTDFINDDFLYSNERGDMVRAYLETHPDALVFMTHDVYARLYGLAQPHEYPEHVRRFQPSLAKSMGSWLSTVHYRGLAQEVRLKDERWRRTVGDWLRPRYAAIAEFGRIVVLAPS